MGYASINSTTFLLPQVTGLDMNAAWGSENNPEITAPNVLYVFLPGHENNRDLAIAELGFLEAQAEYDMNDNLLYWYIEIDN